MTFWWARLGQRHNLIGGNGMRFKGIHLSKLGQKSSQNQVDYTCKNVSFFFFLVGIYCGWEGTLLLRSPKGSQEWTSCTVYIWLVRISVRPYRATEIRYLTLHHETELDEYLIVLIEMLLFYEWLLVIGHDCFPPPSLPSFSASLSVPDEKFLVKQSQESGT